MLLTINQIIAWHDDDTGDKWDERVLHIFPDSGEAAVIDVAAKDALPIFRSLEELEEEISKGNAIVLAGDSYAPRHFTEDELDSKKLRKFKRRRDKALRIIAPLFEGENAVRMLFARDRAALIKARRRQIRSSSAGDDRACEKTIYKYCRRWWQRGQLSNAVLPYYDNCGARRNKARRVTKKLGRPSRLTQHSRTNGKPTIVTGANMTLDWIEKIKIGGTLFYENRLKPSFGWAYRQTLARFFIKDKIIEDGQERIITLDPAKGEIFTQAQFRYHYLLNRDARRAANKRSRGRFNTLHRELKGKSTARGPGFRNLVDATIADIYLRSRYGGNLIIGRPIIWVMIDLFSRMITGVCVRLEGEGWLGLQLVLENTVEDKVAFCAKYGIKISKEQWPAQHRPVEILGDRGPLIREAINPFIKAFNVVVSNTPPYRPDWKGVVERIFGEMNIRVFKWLPGFVVPERGPGQPDYRLDAVFDIEELTAIIIEAVLYHNNECLVSDGVEIDPAFLAEDLAPIPTGLFNWGAHHRPGGLRESDFDSVRRSLLLEGKVSVNKGEIKFRHPKAPKPLLYKCDQLEEQGLLLRGTGAKGRHFKALYDLRWADEIYLMPEAGRELLPCRLRDEDSIHANRDWAEVVQYMEEVQVQRDRQGSVVLQSAISFEHRMKNRVAKAKRKLADERQDSPKQSKAEMLRGIASNRKTEIARMHEEEANQLRLNKDDRPLSSSSTNHSQVERKGTRYSRGPQIPNIADLRKRRMGR